MVERQALGSGDRGPIFVIRPSAQAVEDARRQFLEAVRALDDSPTVRIRIQAEWTAYDLPLRGPELDQDDLRWMELSNG